MWSSISVSLISLDSLFTDTVELENHHQSQALFLGEEYRPLENSRNFLKKLNDIDEYRRCLNVFVLMNLKGLLEEA